MNGKNKVSSPHLTAKRLVCMLLVMVSLFGSVTPSGMGAAWNLGTVAEASGYTYTYYPKCPSSCKTITAGLNAINVNSSYANRKNIAILNGFSNYTGTAAQNTQMLNLLKRGKLIKTKTAAWEIDIPNSISVKKGETTSVTVRFKGSGISSYGGSISGNAASAGFFSPVWNSAGQWCSVKLRVTGNQVGTSKITFRLYGSNPTSKAMTVNVTGSSIPLANLSSISWIKQGSKTCKATSLAMALNLIVGKNTYTTSKMGNSNCKSVQGQTFKGSNGVTYKATYKTDSYVGSYTEEKNAIDRAIALGVPVVAAVHSTKSGYTKHHWIVIVGKQGSDYLIVDPASGSSGTMAKNAKTMSAAKYALGLTDYSKTHYGYITFTN